jgi:pyruvate kinase
MTKKTKIVATLGLVSDTKETLGQMIDAGMNVARLNFSHGSYEWHGNVIKVLRGLSAEKGVAIGILADLQGPRIRTMVDAPVEMKKGDIVLLSDVTHKDKIPAGKEAVFLDIPDIVNDIEVGNEILIEDGLMKVVVRKKENGVLETEVIDGGIVNNHKGVNIPDAVLHINPVTEKDEKDLEFALKNNVDFVAMSFVSSGADIENLRNRMKKILGREDDLPQIIAKIERKEAIRNLDDIILHTDAVMVARGDLGIEIDETRVAILQKEIIKKSLMKMKPVIVATQMLNSMIENPRPTRAEVSDVSNAVIDHTDAVMLSGESASGKYPVESVVTMGKIIKQTEDSPFDDLEHGYLGDSNASVSAAVANSAHELAKDSGAKAIVVGSMTGFTAKMIARHRPEQVIYAITNNEKTHNQLSILWGTESFVLSDCGTLDSLIDKSVEVLVEKKLLKKKDRVVIVTGRPHVKKEHMSLVKVEEIK